MGKPVHTNTVCSDCGLPWDDHKDQSAVAGEPETIAAPQSECIRLLKAELAKRPQPRALSPNGVTQGDIFKYTPGEVGTVTYNEAFAPPMRAANLSSSGARAAEAHSASLDFPG